MDSLGRKIQLGIIAVFLAFILISALRTGLADVVSLNANHLMNAWHSARRMPSVEQIETVTNRLDFARYLTASDPAIYENMARTRLIRAVLPGATAEEKRAQLRAGLSEIRIATRLRPISPYSWVILLAIKRDLKEFDAEFRTALHRALELGPWEPRLLPVLIDVGSDAWSSMPAQEQALIQQLFIRGLEKRHVSIRDELRVRTD